MQRSSLLLIFALLLTGCSNSGPKLGQVTGNVTLDGNPLVDAELSFMPTKGGRTAMAQTDDQGSYTLIYSMKAYGGEVGENLVRISKYISPKADGSQTQSIPARYNEQSELTFTIKPGQNTYNIELTSK
jgi:hypothetical protein